MKPLKPFSLTKFAFALYAFVLLTNIAVTLADNEKLAKRNLISNILGLVGVNAGNQGSSSSADSSQSSSAEESQSSSTQSSQYSFSESINDISNTVKSSTNAVFEMLNNLIASLTSKGQYNAASSIEGVINSLKGGLSSLNFGTNNNQVSIGSSSTGTILGDYSTVVSVVSEALATATPSSTDADTAAANIQSATMTSIVSSSTTGLAISSTLITTDSSSIASTGSDIVGSKTSTNIPSASDTSSSSLSAMSSTSAQSSSTKSSTSISTGISTSTSTSTSSATSTTSTSSSVVATSTTASSTTTSAATTTSSSSSAGASQTSFPSICNGNIRVRKEVHDLSPGELDRLTAAVKKMQSTPSTIMPSLSKHEWYVSVHRKAANVVHNAPVFLPWHRYLTYLYETDLRQIDPGLTLPYWNWTLYSQSPGYDPVLSDRMLGSNQDSNWCVVSGPFAGWKETYPSPRCLRRGYQFQNNGGDTFASPADIRALVVGVKEYATFENQLEVTHFKPHIWIGTSATKNDGKSTVGDMGNVPQSPNDFLFYVHHSFVDKVYLDWQNIYDKSFNNYASLTEQLPYLNKTVQDVINLSSLCITYEETKLSPQVITSASSSKRNRLSKIRRLHKRRTVELAKRDSLTGASGLLSGVLDLIASNGANVDALNNVSLSSNDASAFENSTSGSDLEDIINGAASMSNNTQTVSNSSSSGNGTVPDTWESLFSDYIDVPELDLTTVKTPQPLPDWMIQKMNMNVSQVRDVEKAIDDRRKQLAAGTVSFESLFSVTSTFSTSIFHVSISGGSVVHNSSSSVVIQSSSS